MEFAAFVPLVVTWWALGQALANQNDDFGSFLEGWAAGFTSEDKPWWALSSVATLDALILLGVAFGFLVVRTVSAFVQPHQAIDDAVRTSSEAFASSVNRLSEVSGELQRHLHESLTATREESTALLSVLAHAGRLDEPIRLLGEEIAKFGSSAHDVSSSLGDVSSRMDGFLHDIEQALAGVAEQHQILAGALQRLTASSRDAHDRVVLVGEKTTASTERTLVVAGQLESALRAINRSLQSMQDVR